MLFKIFVSDLIRKTPNKILIVFFVFGIVGIGNQKFKVLNAYKELRVKEVELKRKVIYNYLCKRF